MPSGGKRKGAGRPPGSATRRTREIANKAAASGLLPHEFLLAVARGEAIEGVTPTFADRLDAAKAAAPYFAPRLAAVDLKAEGEVKHVIRRTPMTARDWAIERAGLDQEDEQVH